MHAPCRAQDRPRRPDPGDVWNTILAMSRLPFLVGLDFKAMIAANNVAIGRLGAKLIARYGTQTLKASCGTRTLRAAQRARLRDLPDGSSGQSTSSTTTATRTDCTSFARRSISGATS